MGGCKCCMYDADITCLSVVRGFGNPESEQNAVGTCGVDCGHPSTSTSPLHYWRRQSGNGNLQGDSRRTLLAIIRKLFCRRL